MKLHTIVWALALTFLLAAMAPAADVNGKWVSTMTTPDGQSRQSTMNFKVEGSALTGTISGRAGDTPISEGKVSGDQISFVVVRSFGGNEIRMNYQGKVSGNEIQFTVSAGERSFEVKATRAVD